MTAAVITPVHSQESNDGSFSHDWCSKIQEGMEISQVDWEKFAEEKVRSFILKNICIEEVP